jgi:hypothetical protein
MIKYIVGFALIIGFTGLLSAQGTNPNTQFDKAQDVQLNTITTAVPFLGITPDSRSGAMGDVGAGLSADANSLYWNTSKLAFAEKDFEISVSYSPWLQRLAKDIHLSYLSGYKKLGERHAVGGSLRYFSLGNITFTDNSGNKVRDFTPSEFELTAGYAFKLSRVFSIGLNGKYIFSNLTGGTTVAGANTQPGQAGAADLSFSYYETEKKWFGKKLEIGFGLTISNIGNKITYSSSSGQTDFLPTNLRLGTALKTHLDEYNTFTFAVDVNKLLVPTPPVRVNGNDGNQYWVGKDNNVGVITGIFQSFADAPGRPLLDENGQAIVENGEVLVKDNSRFGEELREINFGIGMEYWYNNVFAVRAGYFHEDRSKGNRQYLTFGIGLQYNVFGLDISYLQPFSRLNPLANTLRFTLRFIFDKRSASRKSDD